MSGGLDNTEISLLALIFAFLAVLVTIRLNEWPHTAAGWLRLQLAWRAYRTARKQLRQVRNSSFAVDEGDPRTAQLVLQNYPRRNRPNGAGVGDVPHARVCNRSEQHGRS